MFCPKCSQQVSNNYGFCSRCGFVLDSIKNLVADYPSPQDNKPEPPQEGPTPYQKGMRRGFQFVLLSLVLIPAYILLAALFPANDVLVESAPSDTTFEKVSQAILATLFMVGLARMAYAYLFERSRRVDPPDQTSPSSGKILFPFPATCIETERVETVGLVEPGGANEQEPDPIKRR